MVGVTTEASWEFLNCRQFSKFLLQCNLGWVSHLIASMSNYTVVLHLCYNSKRTLQSYCEARIYIKVGRTQGHKQNRWCVWVCYVDQDWNQGQKVFIGVGEKDTRSGKLYVVRILLDCHPPFTDSFFSLSSSSQAQRELPSEIRSSSLQTPQYNSNHHHQPLNHLNSPFLLESDPFLAFLFFFLSHSSVFLCLLIFSSNIIKLSCSCLSFSSLYHLHSFLNSHFCLSPDSKNVCFFFFVLVLSVPPGFRLQSTLKFKYLLYVSTRIGKENDHVWEKPFSTRMGTADLPQLGNLFVLNRNEREVMNSYKGKNIIRIFNFCKAQILQYNTRWGDWR
ncbi:hypothetical protein VP01_3167g2 [Puccinia sorghi]|uniref:Uncharacterized protein n=1 Tax=Puccinia sorghi TaxID=27349 RepID=A0A0L6V0M0_9BASI|nr:hypothetical protein VP01_3167g2 [Puccinia sorghi]